MYSRQDRIRYCQYCGATLDSHGQVRCSQCQRVARTPRWFESAFAATVGVASGGWAIAQEASMLGAGASALCTAALTYAFFSIVLRDPTAVALGKRMRWRGTLALLAMMEAISIPAYWGTRADSEVSAVTTALISFVVLPAMVVPLVRLSFRFKQGSLTLHPTCSGCGTQMSPRGSFCGLCGTRR